MYDITTIIIDLVGIFLFVRTIVCFWMIFDKAGRHGWEALIPIWNIYVYFKIAGRKNWFWVLFITPILWIIASLIFWFISNPTMYSVRADSGDLYSINQSQEIQGWANPDISTLNCYGSCPTCNCGGGYREGYREIRDLSETGIQFQIIKNIVNRILGLLALILPLVANILVQFGLAKKFGKGVGFGFGLFFLNPIFIGILAFDDSTYNANNTKKSE